MGLGMCDSILTSRTSAADEPSRDDPSVRMNVRSKGHSLTPTQVFLRAIRAVSRYLIRVPDLGACNAGVSIIAGTLFMQQLTHPPKIVGSQGSIHLRRGSVAAPPAPPRVIRSRHPRTARQEAAEVWPSKCRRGTRATPQNCFPNHKSTHFSSVW